MEERGVPGGALEEEEKKELEHRVLALWKACAKHAARIASLTCAVITGRGCVFADKGPEAQKEEDFPK